MAQIEFACNGCIRCCDNFALPIDVLAEVQETHPGLLKALYPFGRKGVAVHCNEAIPGFGCNLHPSIIGLEIRPKFCPGPKPDSCIMAQTFTFFLE